MTDPPAKPVDGQGSDSNESEGRGLSDAIVALRRRLIEAAVKTWKNQLVDLSARNNLLYYRDLKVGTLDFTGKETHLDAVLSGKAVRLSRAFAAETPRVAFAKRARGIRNKAREAYEERGLETLFITHGMATWHEDTDRRTEPEAPVVLVPVSLEPVPGASQTDFDLQIAGEPRINPTLLRKLEQEFTLPLAAEEFDSELIDAESTTALASVFPRLAQLAHTIPGFGIRPRTVLGTFSYAKLPMVLDLDRAREELAQHELIAALCGDEDARATLRERNRGSEPVTVDLPDRTPPANEHLVLDADSSQSYAINLVLAGRDVIIQGPPGTGKSQTIANLIAALIADGKTVLFVAEKRAAIDAVFKRLHKVGLSDLLLDMHDGQKRRAVFSQELMEAVRSHGAEPVPLFERDHAALTRAREELNSRNEAQHAAREPWGVSVYEARTRLAGLPEVAVSNLRYYDKALLGLTDDVVRTVKDLLRQWFAYGARDVYQRQLPWSYATVTAQADAEEALTATREAMTTLRAVVTDRDGLAEQTGFPPAFSVNAWTEQLTLVEQIRETAAVFRVEFLGEDMCALLGALAPISEGGWARGKSQLVSRQYRAAKKIVKQALSDDAPKLGPIQLYEQLGLARDRQGRWRALAGDRAMPVVPDILDASRAAHDRMRVALDRLAGFMPGLPLDDRPLDDLEATLTQMVADPVTLGTMVQVNPIERKLRDFGLGELFDQVRDESLLLDEAMGRLDHVWLSSIVETLSIRDAWVAAVKGPDQTVAEFQTKDRLHIATGPPRVRRACAERAVHARDEHYDQGLLVERQSKLRPRSRKHLPVRDFFAQAPDVLRALKPCWAMSPLVVSQTLPAERELFDVVIFDEASQVTPADAIPAILRGRQLVVAGDTRQLPPTAFFVSAVEGDEDDEVVPVDAGTEGYESILDALAGLVREQMLTWHYRSRDERLISFSNVRIYNRGLTTFPGVQGDETIRHVLVNQQPGQIGTIEESSSPEVESVVDLILEHASERPDESLGVIAMGIKHAERIAEALRRRREQTRLGDADDVDDDADLDEFFDEHREEPFFVKNLERVQGDERDAIILTIGYGKDPVTGRMHYRFGPLLQDGGERRLNVAVTRAKRRMTVVSSFTASDLEPDKLKKEGAKLLRGYLAYVESGGSNLGAFDELPPELNPFEIQIRDALTKEGIDHTPQLGVSGYRIDFAIKHPEEPGRYVLAIECDGASYHSSPTARERDRLRQEHLELLGWRFCRIWSSEWFNDRDRQLQRVLDAFHHAVAFADDEDDASPFRGMTDEPVHLARDSDEPLDRSNRTESRGSRGPRPPIYRSYAHRDVVTMVRWIENDTLLRTRDELLRETLYELGFQRDGPRIHLAIDQAIDEVRGSRQRDSEAGVPPRPKLDSSLTEPKRSKATVGDLRGNPAVRIRYLPKTGHGNGSQRVVNPLHFSGKLMWAWCHKRADIRCFNIDRIREWNPEPAEEWPAPERAAQEARNKAHSFAPRSL